MAITPGAVAPHKVTDIATLHYLKKVKHSSCMNWITAESMIPLTAKVPVREFAEELKRRGR
ncbi:MAG: hypothetical protein ACLRYD_16950 [Ruminococcus callidus]